MQSIPLYLSFLYYRKYEPEDIPKDWDPFKKVKEYLNKDQAGYNINQSQRYQELNPQKRAAMLGEDKGIHKIRALLNVPFRYIRRKISCHF